VRKQSPFAILLTIALVSGAVLGARPAGVHAAPPAPRRLSGQTPDVIAHGKARRRGHHNGATTLTLNVGLGAHNTARLDALMAAAGDPSSPQYGRYLTRQEYRDQFAPTDAEVQAVRDWATGAGLRVERVSPDNLLVTVRGAAGVVERALGVTLDDYSAAGQSFTSNDRDATVPAGLDVRAISGLSTLHRFHVMSTPVPVAPDNLRGNGYYFPQDFRAAYNVGPAGDGTGSGQTIGLTLWGAALAQSDLNTFASNTGTTRLVGGQAGADGVDWIYTNGPVTDTHELMETAMDVEYAHGVAPGVHLKYWLGDCAYDAASGNCNPSDVGLENAISAAANDASLHAVSNSWGGGEATSASDPFVLNTDASFQRAAAVGTTFYFSSGDNGKGSGCDTKVSPGCAAPSYPADDPYVVSVGGTNLSTTSAQAYNSESAWSGSGGGCSTVFARPSWQTGLGTAATCAGRAEPDVSADADPNSGAYVYEQGSGYIVGGTSLAAPLWAGMAAIMNRYLGGSGMGFAAPRLYQLATNGVTYSRDFHDVTGGNNGYAAGAGWDEATGWGSPNLANLAADWLGPAPGPANSTATIIASPTVTSTLTPTNTPPPTATSTPSAISTSTATTPFATATSMPVATTTATTAPPTSTNTATPSATNTTPPTATNSPALTSTLVPPASVPTSTATPSSTAAIGTTPTPPTIVNGGFEQPTVGASTYTAFQYRPTGGSWIFTGNSGISGNGSGFTSGNPNAPEGQQVAFLQMTGVFSQTVNGFQPNTTYTLTFAVARRVTNGGNEDFQVFLDGNLLGSYTPSSATYASITTPAFTTTVGTHTLKFVGVDSAGGDNTAFIDTVRLSVG